MHIKGRRTLLRQIVKMGVCFIPTKTLVFFCLFSFCFKLILHLFIIVAATSPDEEGGFDTAPEDWEERYISAPLQL